MGVLRHGIVFCKVIKLVLNILVLSLYRYGDEGYFLGASHNRNHDAEALAAGIFIGYFIYNIVSLVVFFIDGGGSTTSEYMNPNNHGSSGKTGSVMETMWNGIGFLLWIITGAVVLQFWLRFDPANHQIRQNPSASGIAMGIVTIVNAAVYGAECALSVNAYRK